MTLKELIQSKNFQDKHILFLIIEHILWLNKEQVYLNWEKEISDNNFEKIKKLFDKYEKENIPIEYILWYCEFMWEKFEVNEYTLIPRPETEYLIKYAIDEIKNNPKISYIADIGTWSWIIWIMLNKITKLATICSDISEKALQVAIQNNKKINPNSKNIEFIVGDLEIKGNFAKDDEENNYIVCANLPYLETDYKLDKLAEKEPSTALYAGEDWLDLYRKLLKKLKDEKYIWFFELTKKQWEILNKEFNLNWKLLNTCHNNIKILYIDKINKKII